jgi:hypothetical protein
LDPEGEAAPVGPESCRRDPQVERHAAVDVVCKPERVRRVAVAVQIRPLVRLRHEGCEDAVARKRAAGCEREVPDRAVSSIVDMQDGVR